MEFREKKEWLNRAYKIEETIKADKEEIKKLDALIYTGFGIDYEKPNVQTSKKPGAFFENKVAKLADIKKEYVNRVTNQEMIKNEIRARIDTLDSNKEKTILILRHIQFKDWYDIAAEVDEPRRTCFRLYNNAINKINL